MTDKIAIRVSHLSKKYRLGGPQEKYLTLRDAIASSLKAPLKRFYKVLPDEQFWALKDVSFDVEHGEVLGIIGRNGAGKSTLLKILSRITPPTEGTVEIHGRVGSLLEVGTGFHPEMTGRENIFLNGSILGMKKNEIEGKFDEIIKFSEIEKFIDTPVKRYSSGMYVRLAFAVAAHLEPEILVVDEVLAVGDMAFQKKCLGKMQDVSKSGRTVLFVSHNMSAVTSLCHRSILLEKGTIVLNGKTEDVVAHYVGSSTGLYGKSEWKELSTAPGKNGFKLLSFECLNEDYSPIKIVNIEKPILFRVGYVTTIPNMKFRIAVPLYSGGICAFITLEQQEFNHEVAGKYFSDVKIPGNFLAERDYSVNLSVFSSRGSKVHYCQMSNLLTFQVYDPLEGTSARGDYRETLLGIMQPKLQWNKTFIEKIEYQKTE